MQEAFTTWRRFTFLWATTPLQSHSVGKLVIYRKAMGEGHPAFAGSLNSLAELYKAMGKYAAAEPLYRQALEIHRSTLGEDHPDFALTLNNLASLYDSMGNYAAAEPLYRQAVEIKRKGLGEDHSDLATTLNHLAVMYHSMGNYAAAEPLGGPWRRGAARLEKMIPTWRQT